MSDKVTTGGVSPRADKIFKIIITVLALVMCFIQIGKYISIGGKPIVNMYYLRIYALHYMFGMLFAFLMYDWKGKASGWTGLKKKWPDLILSAAAIAVAVYVMIDPSSFQTRLSITANQNDIIFGALATVVTIAAAYKLSGKALPIMAVIFIGYAFLGKYIPGGFGHRGYSLQRVIVNIFGDQGIWGSALATSCNIIFLFILFGAFLEVSGANEIFRDLSISLAGAKRGGPAKIAVISSAIMGTISGSAIANVVTTGAFTIPLMKKQKYRDEFAGAVEAVSSTGGQLMPPVMGAAAFLMAEATAIPYGTICLAALVPALMYYICIFSTVDVESLKANLTGMDLKDIPKLLPVLKKSAKLLLPIAVLILSLCVFGFSTSRSALYSMAVLIICCCFDKDDRFSLKKLVNALRSGAIGSTTVITATAICGIIISMLTMTGLGVKFSSHAHLPAAGHAGVHRAGHGPAHRRRLHHCFLHHCHRPHQAGRSGSGGAHVPVLLLLHRLHHPAGGAGLLCRGRHLQSPAHEGQYGSGQDRHRGLPGALCLYLQSIHPHLRFQQSLHDSGYHRHLRLLRRGCSPHLLCGTGVPLPAHPPV